MNHEEEPVALRSIFRKVRSRTSGARARGRERRRSGGNSRNNNNTYNMANVLDMDELEDMEMDTDEIEIGNTQGAPVWKHGRIDATRCTRDIAEQRAGGERD